MHLGILSLLVLSLLGANCAFSEERSVTLKSVAVRNFAIERDGRPLSLPLEEGQRCPQYIKFLETSVEGLRLLRRAACSETQKSAWHNELFASHEVTFRDRQYTGGLQVSLAAVLRVRESLACTGPRPLHVALRANTHGTPYYTPLQEPILRAQRDVQRKQVGDRYNPIYVAAVGDRLVDGSLPPENEFALLAQLAISKIAVRARCENGVLVLDLEQ